MSDRDTGVVVPDAETILPHQGLCTQEESELASKMIHTAASVEELRGLLEQHARQLARAEVATFFEMVEEGRVINLVGFRDKGKTRISFPEGEGIAGKVSRDNGYCICNDPAQEEIFVAEIDGITGLEVRNLLSTAVTFGEEPVGVIQVVNRKSGPFTESDAYWLQGLAEHAALAYRRLKRSEEGWRFARNLAGALADAVDDKHASTVGHSDRTRQIALAIGKDMRLAEDELLELEMAALLHDIGRLALSPEAFEWVGGPGGAERGYAAPGEKLHLVITEAILRKLELPDCVSSLSDIALAHHEKVDGTGYPKALQAADLSLPARILAVANAYDLLTSGRSDLSRGKPLCKEDAVQLLKARAGSDFDPAVVDRFVKGKLYEIEKRRFPRYDYEAPLEVELIRETGAEGPGGTLETEALNVSEGGILFRSEKEFPIRALLDMKIYLPTETLRALARVARNLPSDTGAGYKVGAYFLWYSTTAERTTTR